MILNENQFKMYDQCIFLNESFINTEKDIWWNKKKWFSNEINVCFVLGFSGSGKSSLTKQLSKNNDKVDFVELDNLIENVKYSDDELKERNPYVYAFLTGPGQKYRGVTFDSTIHVKSSVRDCVDFCIKKQKATKRKLILEGIQLFSFFEPSELENYVVCIKGTSYLTSTYRAAKRELLEKRILRSLGTVFLNTGGLVFFNTHLSKFIRYYKEKKNKK